MNKALGLLTLSLISAALVAQSSPATQDPDWIRNTNDAPLLIISKGNAIILKNRIDKPIESFRLGCVRDTTRSVTVRHRFRTEHTPIPALGDVIYAASDGPPYEQATCKSLRAKLSVLETSFKDGTTWRLLAISSHESRNQPAKK